MKKLDIYLGTTVGMTTLLAFGGLIGLFALFTMLDQVEDIKGDYTFWRALLYIAFSLPRMFYDTLPYATLIGCLTGLGLLASNSELIVMRAAGVSTWRIARAVMIPTITFVILGLLAGELVLPDFERTARAIREQARADDITPRGGFWYRENEVFMHFKTVSHDGDLTGVQQFDSRGNRITGTRFANSASYNQAGGYWTLHQVIETQFEESIQLDNLGNATGDLSRLAELTQASNQPGFRQQFHEQLHWHTTLTPDILSTEILVEPSKMSMMELQRKINHLAAQGLNTGKFEIGFFTKLLQPLAGLSLVLVAISFIFGPLREASLGMRTFCGLVIGLTFKFTQDLLAPASLVFGFSPLLAAILPITLCLLAGYLLLKRAN